MAKKPRAGGGADSRLPAGKGVYALLIRLEEPLEPGVGRLGPVKLPAGYCLYFGSAMGGLAGRIRRHLRRRKKLRWHVDYLTSIAVPDEVWWMECEERAECGWAAAGLLLPGASAPAPGFGASDCRCGSHLVHVPERPTAAEFRRLLGPGPVPAIGVLRAAGAAGARHEGSARSVEGDWETG